MDTGINWTKAFNILFRIIHAKSDSKAPEYISGPRFLELIAEVDDSYSMGYREFMAERDRLNLSQTRKDYYKDILNDLPMEKRIEAYRGIIDYLEEFNPPGLSKLKQLLEATEIAPVIQRRKVPVKKDQDRIFLCHASEDKGKVMEVYNKLKESGLNPWLDKMDLLPGQDWDREIRQALKNSRFIIIFFSKHSVSKRGYVQREFKLALDTLKEIPDGQIFIIPVKLNQCQIPEPFTHIQYIDLFEGGDFDLVIQVIGTELKAKEKKVAQKELYKLVEKILGLRDRIANMRIENMGPDDQSQPRPELEELEKAKKSYHTLTKKYKSQFKESYDPLSNFGTWT